MRVKIFFALSLPTPIDAITRKSEQLKNSRFRADPV